MKEDDGLGSKSGSSPTPKDTGNKADKDMKGLVYQGGEPAEEAPAKEKDESYPTDSTTPPPEELKDEKGDYAGISAPSGSDKDDSILNLTESSGRGKLIVIIAIVAIIVIGIAYLVLHSNGAKPPKVTTTIKGNTPTTTISVNRNKTVIANLNILYNYTGPAKVNNATCGLSKTSTVKSYSARYNASATFYLFDSPVSGACPLSVNKITATTKGFKIIQSNPPLPVSIPAHSSVYILMKVQTPAFNYTGPLSVTINEN